MNENIPCQARARDMPGGREGSRKGQKEHGVGDEEREGSSRAASLACCAWFSRNSFFISIFTFIFYFLNLRWPAIKETDMNLLT